MSNTKSRVAALYEQLATRRLPFLERGRLAARYTIPALLPPEGHSYSNDLYKPYQSIGSRGTNNLSSRLGTTLLPPNRPMFRLVLSEKLASMIPADERPSWDQALSLVEKAVRVRLETLAIRPPLYEAFRHLIVAGNVLLHITKDGMRMFSLDKFVVRRDFQGRIMDIIVREKVDHDGLPESVRRQLKTKPGDADAPKDVAKELDLYTHIYRKGDQFHIYQMVEEIKIPESEGTYPAEKCPWIALRWTRIDGEDYGRSHCDDYLGDLTASEWLSRTIIRGSAIAAKVVFLANPNGVTDPNDLQNAEEGDVIEGTEGDISVLGLDKFADFQIAKATLDEVNGRLAYAFLLNSAVRRQGERVTAEEIRTMIAELEDQFSGNYSQFSSEFQLPLISAVMAMMQKEGELPQLPAKSIRPAILTGVDALGRAAEATRLDTLGTMLNRTFGPETSARVLKMGGFAKKLAAGLELDADELVKTDEEQAREAQMAAAQSVAQQVAPHAVKAATEAQGQAAA